MPTPLMGLLLLFSVAAVPACILVIVLMLRNPPRSLSRICAVLALIFGFSATAVYCYGWFSVTLGGRSRNCARTGTRPAPSWRALSRISGPSATPVCIPTDRRWSMFPHRSTCSSTCWPVLPSL